MNLGLPKQNKHNEIEVFSTTLHLFAKGKYRGLENQRREIVGSRGDQEVDIPQLLSRKLISLSSGFD